jgi:hypothetical protein
MKIICYQGEEEVLSEDFLVEHLKKSSTLQHLLEDCGEEMEVIPNILLQKNVLDHIFLFLSGTLNESQFLEVSNEMFFEVTNACNYLGIDSLLPLCLKHIATKIRGKSPEELREFFGVENDLTPEMEERIKKENEWIYQ